MSQPSIHHVRIPLCPISDDEQAWIRQLEQLADRHCEPLRAGDHDGAVCSFVSMTIHLLGDFLWERSAGSPRWEQLEVGSCLTRLRENPGCSDEWVALFAVTAVAFYDWLASEQLTPSGEAMLVAMAFELHVGGLMATLGYTPRYVRQRGRSGGEDVALSA